jgi:hypothetical protein
MRISGVLRGLSIALLATAARGQTVSAGARAVVASETLPVYAAMSSTSAVKATLSRGEAVVIGLVLFGDDITWCAVSKGGETRRLGFASCEFLEPDRGSSAAPAAAPVQAPRAPIRIRELPQAPITIREVPPSIAASATVPAFPQSLPAAKVPEPAAPATAPVPARPVEPMAPAPAVVDSVPVAPAPARLPAPVPKPVAPMPAAPPAVVVESVAAAPAAPPRPTPVPESVAPALGGAPAVVVESVPAAPAAPPRPAPIPEPIAPTPGGVPAVVVESVPAAPAAPPRPAPIPEPIAPTPAAPPAVVVESVPAPVAPRARLVETARVEPPPIPVREEPAPAGGSDFIPFALDRSGLSAALTSYTRTTRLVAFLDKTRLAEIDGAALEGALAEQFQGSAFLTAIGNQLRSNSNPARLATLLEWLGSPASGKLADLERRALLPESRDELVTFADGLRKAPPTESRLLLVHRLYDSLKTCDMEVESTIALVHTVALAIGPALPKEKRYSAVELDRALGAVKSRYRSIMRNARIVHYLFAYQSASDEELEQFVSFLESESGKWFVGLVDKGFYEATEAISRGLSDQIPRTVRAKRR